MYVSFFNASFPNVLFLHKLLRDQPSHVLQTVLRVLPRVAPPHTPRAAPPALALQRGVADLQLVEQLVFPDRTLVAVDHTKDGHQDAALGADRIVGVVHRPHVLRKGGREDGRKMGGRREERRNVIYGRVGVLIPYYTNTQQ